jgi:ABC-2 type transport system ATP-binding protein
VPRSGPAGSGGVTAHALGVSLRGRRVLDDVSFNAPQGALALVGNNGAGKSTLLRVLATLQPAEGSITAGGRDLTTWSGVRSARRTLGYLPAEADAPAAHTVIDAVTYGAWLTRVPRARRAQAVDRAIELVGLTARRGDRLTTLSSGLRARALIARAVVHEPALVLLDEPTAAIDPEQRGEIRRMIRQLAADRMVVFSTHLAEDIEHAADHALVLRDGAVAWAGPSPDLLALGRTAARGTDEGTLEAALHSFDHPSSQGADDAR